MTWGEAVGVLRERRFAWYFAARTVSTAGTAMAPVALAFAVLHLTDSAGALAQVSVDIQQRQLAHFDKADPAYGTGVRGALERLGQRA